MHTKFSAQDLWTQISTPTAPLESIPLAILAAAMIVLVTFQPTWVILRGVITIVHEGAHALIALVMGRKLNSIRLHSDTSGLTVSRGKPRGFGMILTAFAGYVGPTALGLVAAWVVSLGYTLAWVWAFVVILILMLFKIRNLFGAWSLVATGVVVGGLAWFGPEQVRVYLAYGLVALFLIGAPRPVFELMRQRRRGQARTSDADALARITWLPAWAWLGIFMLVTLGGVAGGYAILR